MNFVKDSNNWGPFIDGSTFETGTIFAGEPAFGQVFSPETGMFHRHPVGRHAPAERVNGVVRLTGEWVG